MKNNFTSLKEENSENLKLATARIDGGKRMEGQIMLFKEQLETLNKENEGLK